MSFAKYNISVPENSDQDEVRAICPECTPSRKPAHQNEKDLSVNIKEGAWHCHHCGWSGSLNTQKREAIEYYPQKIDPIVKFFQDRGISRLVMEKTSTGYQPPKGKLPGAIMFPRYKHGEVVAIKYRTANKRMWQSKNPEPCFYNYDIALASGADTLIITEGEIDTMSWIEAGFDNVVSVPDGAPAASTKNFGKKLDFLNDGLIESFNSFILSVDNDEPGKILEEELVKRIGIHKCLRISYPDGCKDINDVLVKHGCEALKQCYARAKPFPINGLYTAEDVWDSVIEMYGRGLRPGKSTGWKSLDEKYTVRTCEFTVITGMPGSGKSTFLDALVVNLNREHGWKIAFCSPENWPIQRHIASITEKLVKKPFGSDKTTSPQMTKAELENAMKQMNDSFYFTQLQESDMSVDGILDVMQAAISRNGVKGIVLDPWNELECQRPAKSTETEFVSEALGKIRRFARMNDVHVWIVAHPAKMKKNDDGTYPVPKLYDISGSAHWFNKADNGLSIYRPDYTKDEVEIYIQKIRFREIGKLGRVNLKFAKECGIFLET